jgi:hypothetical protein
MPGCPVTVVLTAIPAGGADNDGVATPDIDSHQP